MEQTATYTRLISDIRDTIYRLALSIVGDVAEAEDIVQDIFERAWRARDAVLESEYPGAYICRMTRNLAIDRLRHKERHKTLSIDYRQAGADGNNSTNLNDMAATTRQIIAALPEKQRTAIHLRDVEGYEIEEIAEILDSDATSIRMNLSRARKSVREQLIKLMNYGVEQH